jgi:hypothetical protein
MRGTRPQGAVVDRLATALYGPRLSKERVAIFPFFVAPFRPHPVAPARGSSNCFGRFVVAGNSAATLISLFRLPPADLSSFVRMPPLVTIVGVADITIFYVRQHRVALTFGGERWFVVERVIGQRP